MPYIVAGIYLNTGSFNEWSSQCERSIVTCTMSREAIEGAFLKLSVHLICSQHVCGGIWDGCSCGHCWPWSSVHAVEISWFLLWSCSVSMSSDCGSDAEVARGHMEDYCSLLLEAILQCSCRWWLLVMGYCTGGLSVWWRLWVFSVGMSGVMTSDHFEVWQTS